MKREIAGDIFIISAGLILLVLGVILYLVNPQGYYVQEPNYFILIPETAVSLLILFIGIERAIDDRGCSAHEAFGNVIVILLGVMLSGMFISILVNHKVMMYSIESWYIVVRSVIAVAVIVLGIERLIDDARRRI